MKPVEVFTDGACRGNPGPGGWGAVLRHQQREKELFGGERATTNNRMELTAAIRALEALTERCRVEITTDSVYVKDGITKWLDGWRARGWRTAKNKPAKNQDLWNRPAALVEGHDRRWRSVKGHAARPEHARAGHPSNCGMYA